MFKSFRPCKWRSAVPLQRMSHVHNDDIAPMGSLHPAWRLRAASFVFNEKLAAVFPDRLDRLRLDVVIAARHAEDVPGDALAGYAINYNKARVMQAVDQTHTPVVF